MNCDFHEDEHFGQRVKPFLKVDSKVLKKVSSSRRVAVRTEICKSMSNRPDLNGIPNTGALVSEEHQAVYNFLQMPPEVCIFNIRKKHLIILEFLSCSNPVFL